MIRTTKKIMIIIIIIIEIFHCSSQEEDLAKYGLSNKKKQDKQQSHEDISENLADEDYEIIESPATTTSQPYLMLTKQNSFEHEHDESLGILTPDQMTDFTVALDSSRTPSCENLSANTSSMHFSLLSLSL